MSYPTNTVSNVFSHLDRWLDDLFVDSTRWPASPTSSAYVPPVNVWDDGNAFHLEAALPGADAEKLELEVLGDKLIFSGEFSDPTPADAKRQRQERPTGSFRRELTFPAAIDSQAVKAQLKNGLLTVELPRAEAAKPRQIKVGRGD